MLELLLLALLACFSAAMAIVTWRWRRLGYVSDRLTIVVCVVQLAAVTAPGPAMMIFGTAPTWLTCAYAIVYVVCVGVWLRHNRHLIAVELPTAASCASTPAREPLVELHITRGLPASGKSTLARQWRDVDRNRRARINRDDTRRMLHGGRHGEITEQQVTIVAHGSTMLLLRAGINVICDDTNLDEQHFRRLVQLAAVVGARVVVHDLRHTALSLCLHRNAQRTGDEYAPPEEIIRMYRAHIAPRIRRIASLN